MKAIFTGSVRDWSEVPGAKISGSIDLVDRVASSGTQDAFQNIFLGETMKISPSAEAEESNGLVQNKIRTDENAIGFVSFDFTTGTNAVGYQGIPCTLQNAKSGQYQGVRNFWMVTKGAPKGLGREVHRLDHERQRDHEKDHRLGLDPDPLEAEEIRPSNRTPTPIASPAVIEVWLLGGSHLIAEMSERREDAPLQSAATVSAVHATGAPSSRSARSRSACWRLIALMVVIVFTKAWPSFSHNGLSLVRLRRRRGRAAEGDDPEHAAAGALDLLLPGVAAAVGHAA